MKIALIIFRIGHSHGSLLQTYALSNILKSLGHDVTIINRKDVISTKYLIKRTISNLYANFRGIKKGPIFYKELLPPCIMRNMNSFVDKYYKPNLKEYSELSLDEESFEVYMVGSDQTWRPKFVQSITYYYLDFIERFKNVKRIAYAPSFGTSEWEYTHEQTEKCRRLIKLFNAVSVREKGGVYLCNKYFDIVAEHVVDPTLLLHKEDYVRLFDSTLFTNNQSYIAYSILDRTEYKINLISEVCSLMEGEPLPIIEENRSEFYVETGVEYWLEGIYKSKFVITDSFHATVFAIIMNVPFIVVANKFRGIDRIISLLEICGLCNRIVYENNKNNISNIIAETINWDLVNKRVDLARVKSINFLIKSLQ